MRDFDEGEQETRIVQAFDILKSDVANHIAVRQQIHKEKSELDIPGMGDIRVAVPPSYAEVIATVHVPEDILMDPEVASYDFRDDGSHVLWCHIHEDGLVELPQQIQSEIGSDDPSQRALLQDKLFDRYFSKFRNNAVALAAMGGLTLSSEVRAKLERWRDPNPVMLNLDAETLWETLLALDEMEEFPGAQFEAIGFTQVTPNKIAVRAICDQAGEGKDLPDIYGSIVNAAGAMVDGKEVKVSGKTFRSFTRILHTDVMHSFAEEGVLSILEPDERGLSGLKYEGPCLSTFDLFPEIGSHLEATVTDFMTQLGELESIVVKQEAPVVTAGTMDLTINLPELGQSFDVSINKTLEDGKPSYQPTFKCDIPDGDLKISTAVEVTKAAVSEVVKRYCRLAEAAGFDQDFTKIHGAVIKEPEITKKRSGPQFTKSKPQHEPAAPSMSM
ncbi:hypothetical protein [Roseibium aggregatum]|uniref:hypothetical protein n=1 Tax=Roseibium aggregatum TaxID=187304 RepID=UPI0011A7BA42|nr:hypothetical protein [Roseibium aggregatum]